MRAVFDPQINRAAFRTVLLGHLDIAVYTEIARGHAQLEEDVGALHAATVLAAHIDVEVELLASILDEARDCDVATAVIALTATSLEEERAVVLSAGCDDFIRKPFREADIFDTMHKHIGVRYIYEDIKALQSLAGTNINTSVDIQDALTPTALAALPFDLLTNLEEAAIRSKMNQVDSLIHEIRTLDAPLADALAILAEGFEYPKMASLIGQAKETLRS